MRQFPPGMQHSSTIRLLLAVTLFQGLATRGQSPVFGVYFTSGNIKYSTARGGVRPVGSHTWLNAGDKLMLLDNISDITLFARDTSYVRLQGKANYTVAQLDKMPRTRIRDTIMIQYFSLFWEEAIHLPTSTSTNAPQSGAAPTPTPRTPVAAPRNASIVLAPRSGYATSLDSLIFRWNNVSWARKYFLRLRNPDGRLCYDTVIADTEAIIHFPGHMPSGNTYTWALDIVGESGRLQFADSGHIILINEFAVIPHLPSVPTDSIGGLAAILERIEQYEYAGCIKEAEALFFRLTNDFPDDTTLDKLYLAFRRRNYF
jgi:hypothetical protein